MDFLHITTFLLHWSRNNEKELLMQKEKEVTDDQVNKACGIMARIVRDYGDAYLPIFKRLYDEIEMRKAKADLKNIALQFAQNQ